MPHTAYADVARLTRLAQHFATEAVQAGDVAAFPPPAALAELPAVELRRLLDLVIAYEQGDWDKVVASCTQHNLPTSYLKPCYDTVLEWYNMLQAVS